SVRAREGAGRLEAAGPDDLGAAAQARLQGRRVGRDVIRRVPWAGGRRDRRRGRRRRGLQVLHGRDRARALQRRRAGRRDRAARVRGGPGLRSAARGVREADRAAPGDPAQARADGHQDRGVAPAAAPGGGAQGRRRARRPRGRHGEVVRDRDRAGGRARVDAHPRRRRLLAGPRRRAHLPRGAAAADRRGLERDPAARDRPAAARAPRRLMDFAVSPELKEIRAAVRGLCDRFPGEYWRGLEPDRYPEEFVAALTEQGWLAALIPEEYGGAGLALTAASVIIEEINALGGNAGACHAQMYTMGTILRHGSPEQKQRYLPRIASGELRLQAFGVTEPTVGSDTTSLQTTAER